MQVASSVGWPSVATLGNQIVIYDFSQTKARNSRKLRDYYTQLFYVQAASNMRQLWIDRGADLPRLNISDATLEHPDNGYNRTIA